MMYRDLYRRIVIWQPITGMVVDLAPRYALAGATPTETEQRTAVADGRSVATRRSRVFEVPIVRAEEHEAIALMKRLGCPVRLVALGAARHVLWQEDTNLQSVPERQGPLGMAPERVRLAFNAFDAGIHQGQDLLQGIPWAGASSSDEDGTFVLTHSSLLGYEGPWWTVADGDSVAITGAYSGEGATLRLQFPLGRARVALHAGELPDMDQTEVGALLAGGNALLAADDATTLTFEDAPMPDTIEGQIEALDWHGDTIEVFDPDTFFTLPDRTWEVKVTITSCEAAPRLLVWRAGRPFGVRLGEPVASCDQRAGDPVWA